MIVKGRAEAPTLIALCICYTSFFLLTSHAGGLPGWIIYPALAIVIAFHSSLQHEAIHGHPTSISWINAALVFPPLGLSFPYERYKTTHLQHHQDARLTDPYDDPESWYIDPVRWGRTGSVMRLILHVNNSLAGRMLIGPALGFVRFVSADLMLILSGRGDIARAWGLHLIGGAAVIWWLFLTGVSPIGYVLACYGGLSLINLRSFLEHRAEERVRGRSAIVEDRGPLALLYLNNNLHAVHHAHPEVPWAKLPVLYRAHRARFLEMNGGYVFPSYISVIGRYAVRAKEPPAHPLMQEAPKVLAE
ncbi:MAG: fatty acid desaturase [Pseudomonadota bacterium]